MLAPGGDDVPGPWTSLTAIGRALLREPALVNRYAAGEAATSRGVPCNQCMVKVGYQPTQCVRRPEPIGVVGPA